MLINNKHTKHKKVKMKMALHSAFSATASRYLYTTCGVYNRLNTLNTFKGLNKLSVQALVPRICASRSTDCDPARGRQLRQLHSTSTTYNGNVAQSQSQSSSPKVEHIFQRILELDTIEVHLLTELVNEKMGVKQMSTAQRQAMLQGGGGGGGGGAAAAGAAQEKEEKTAFDLKLTGFDAKAKIKVIKEIRAVTGLGLKEAKELVEGTPKVVKKDIKMEEAEEIKAKIEAVGGTVEIS